MCHPCGSVAQGFPGTSWRVSVLDGDDFPSCHRSDVCVLRVRSSVLPKKVCDIRLTVVTLMNKLDKTVQVYRGVTTLTNA